jgi:small subunit ribosomal protein S9
MSIETKYKKIVVSGKRKTAIAKAVIKDGNGKLLINGKELNSLEMFDKLRISEPLRISEQILKKLNFDVQISIKGGGARGQIDAARLALAKGIIKFTNSDELKQAFLTYDRNMLVADIRRKEMYKPGDSKARKKRQTSYR